MDLFVVPVPHIMEHLAKLIVAIPVQRFMRYIMGVPACADRLLRSTVWKFLCAPMQFLAFLVPRIMETWVGDDEGFVLIKSGQCGGSTTRS